MKRWLLLGLLAGCGTVTTDDELPDGGGPPPSDIDAGDSRSLSIAVPDTATFVRVSGSAAIPVTLSRGATTGDVVVTATTDASGVTFDALTIPAAATTGVLTVHAAADARVTRFDVAIEAASSNAAATTSVSVAVIGLPGNPDTAFGSSGEVQLAEDFVPSSAFFDGGQYVVTSPSRLIRLSPTGEIDQRFGVRGAVQVSPHASGLSTAAIETVVMTPAGHYVLAGHGTRINEVDLGVFVVAVTSSGQPDPARPPVELFGDEETNDRVEASAPGPDGSLYLLVSQSPQSGDGAQTVVVRAGHGGRLDHAFGRVVVATGGRLVALADGGVLRYGVTTIDRITAAGALSPAFGVGGTVTLDGYSRIHDVTTLPDGALVVTGTDGHSMQLTRLRDDGRLDESFGEQGTVKLSAATDFQEYGVRLWIAPDGSTYGAGYTDESSPYLNRLRFFHVTAAGAIDTAYGSNGGTIDAFQWDDIRSVTFGDDHRVLVTGLSYEERGVPSRRIARRYWF
jgi:uncharacterized delta-60 repeat protein